MKIIKLFYIIVFSVFALTASSYANTDVLPTSIFQKLAVFDSISFKYRELLNDFDISENPPKESTKKIFGDIAIINRTGDFYLKTREFDLMPNGVYRYAGDNTKTYEDGVVTHLFEDNGSEFALNADDSNAEKPESDSYSMAYKSKKKLVRAPNVTRIWMDMLYDRPASYIWNAAKSESYKIIEENGNKYYYFPETGLYINAKTLLPYKIEEWTTDDSNNKVLLSSIIFEAYANTLVGEFPSEVRIDDFSDGKLLRKYKYVIDTKSIKFNTVSSKDFVFSLPVGCIMSDNVLNKSYKVDDYVGNNKKEEALMKIIDDLQNKAEEQKSKTKNANKEK